jgi:hypothetical protein
VQQQMNKAKETVTQYSKKLLTITVHWGTVLHSPVITAMWCLGVCGMML